MQSPQNIRNTIAIYYASQPVLELFLFLIQKIFMIEKIDDLISMLLLFVIYGSELIERGMGEVDRVICNYRL